MGWGVCLDYGSSIVNEVIRGNFKSYKKIL